MIQKNNKELFFHVFDSMVTYEFSIENTRNKFYILYQWT